MKNMVVMLTIALLILLTSLTGTQARPPADQYADDPYESWGGTFLDFVPPNPEAVELSQPDGSKLQAVLTPMETGGQLETPDGYTVVKNQQDWWTYAQPGDGINAPADQAMPTQLIPGRDSPNGLPMKVGQHRSIWLDDQDIDKRDAVFEAVKNVQSPNGSAFVSPTTKTKRYHYVVVLAEFQDVKFEPFQTPEYFKNQISGMRASPTGTVSDLYYEMSYGQFLPEFDVIGPFTLPGTMYAYDFQLPGGKSVWNMINDLAPQLTALRGDWWDQYDNDRVVFTASGTQYRSVDMVVVLHAGPGKEATGQNGQVWSHATTANLNTGVASSDNREVHIRGVNTVPAIGFNIGVVAHEMGHTIGEPDYYDTSYRSMGTGDYDLMAGGSWMGNNPAGSNPTIMNPYSRINQGWVAPKVVTATTLGVSLQPRSIAPDVIMIPLGGSSSGATNAEERIYIEYISNRVPGAIFDKAAYSSGLLIWHYDRGGSQTRFPYAPARYRLGVDEYDYLDGTQELQLNLNRGEPTDVWLDTALGMTPNTTPGTNRHTPLTLGGSTSTGWYLMNFSDIGPTMTLDIAQQADVQNKVGVGRPALLNQPVIAGTGPASLSTKVYNLTAADLSNVTVQFVAIYGQQEVPLAATTLPTLPAGAPTVATAAWTVPVAGKWHIEAAASVAGGSAKTPGVARIFPRTASVLIVDDDDGYNAEEAFEGALTSLGVPYTLVEHTAPLALLQQYELVIWSAGQAGRAEGQLNFQEIADLRAYLDAGGKLWIASPRLACALGTSAATPPPVDPAFLRDYLGTSYPMSSQAGGGIITGLGQWIGGTSSFQLRQFPGRAIEDFMDPAASDIASVTPLFAWSYGHDLGVEVIGDAAHNNFHVVYFGFNLSQIIAGGDRLALTQQVLDRMGIASVYFDKATYLMQKSGAVKVTVHDIDAMAPIATVTSTAQPAGITVGLAPTGVPGNFVGVLNVQKTASQADILKVNDNDVLTVVYGDRPEHTVWATSDVLSKKDPDQPATIYHDLIYSAADAQNLPVMAVVADDIRVQKVELYCRVAGQTAFTMLPMEMSARDAYTTLIPDSTVTPLGVEYFIVARDSKGTLTLMGSAASPNFVVVQPRTIK